VVKDAQPAGEAPREVPLVWVGVEDAPIEFLNQFLIQSEAEEFILTLGALAPPVFLGSPEERKEQAAQVRFVPVHVLGRYGLTEHRLREFAELLTRFLEQHHGKSGENDR
jgi:hypothetical protein